MKYKKKHCTRKKLEYQFTEGNKISLLRKNPKEFHKLFKKKNKSNRNNISNNDFYEYSMDLYGCVNNENVNTNVNIGLDDDLPYCETVYEELDMCFTENDVLTAIKKLKSGKSHGTDYIINEYFINFCNELTPIITVLFNKILLSGYFPDQWCNAIIVPKKGDVNDTHNYRGYL